MEKAGSFLEIAIVMGYESGPTQIMISVDHSVSERRLTNSKGSGDKDVSIL